MVDNIQAAGKNVSPESGDSSTSMQQIINEFMGLGNHVKKEKETLIEHIEQAIAKARESGQLGPQALNVTRAFTVTLTDLESGVKPEAAFQGLAATFSLGAEGVGLMNAFSQLRKTLVDATARLKHGEPPEKETKKLLNGLEKFQKEAAPYANSPDATVKAAAESYLALASTAHEEIRSHGGDLKEALGSLGVEA